MFVKRYYLDYDISLSSSYTKLKLGWIPYWNLRPLRIELQKSAQGRLDLIRGHPTKINKLIHEDEVLAAPSSSVNLLLSGHADLALPLGIACDGAVDSVYLGMRKKNQDLIDYIKASTNALAQLFALERMRYGSDMRILGDKLFAATKRPLVTSHILPPMLKLTSRSASGATLTRIFYRLIFGEDSFNEMKNQAMDGGSPAYNNPLETLELVIGDHALIQRSEFEHIIDLGQWWKDFNNLPFVFAVWQRGSRPLSTPVKKMIYEAASLAQAKMQIAPSEYFLLETPHDLSGKPILLENYWSKIRYRLHAADFQALGLFLSLGRNVLNCHLEDSFIVKMNRWEEIGKTLTPSLIM